MVVKTGAGRANGLVEALLRPEAYPEPTESVELRETHISWVFLTDRHAYKLKKPVRFEFLDFSTVGARKAACQAELELNRRWTHGVYLNVVPVARMANGIVCVGSGRGRVVDWMVKMRRLPDDLRLDVRIHRHLLTDTDRERVVRTLATLYRDLPPLPVRADEYRNRVEAHMRANWEELREAAEFLPAIQIERSQSRQWRWLRLHGDVLADRARNGRIVDGHGDLRPDHIYLEEPLAVVDCVEFSDDLRRIDALDDLAFLIMDCRVLGEYRLGERLLEVYRQETGDEYFPALIWFYLAYRASVRAKVSWLRAAQRAGSVDRSALAKAADYLREADEAARQLGPPLLIVMRGVSGSGKSTLAAAVASELGLQRIGTDQLRQQMYGTAPQPQAWRSGKYTTEAREAVYDELFQAAEERLSEGLDAVLDGTFLEKSYCGRASELAERYGAALLFVECRCDEAELKKRLLRRVPGQDAASEADWEVARRQLADYEPLEQPCVVSVDTLSGFPQQLAAVKDAARRLLQQPAGG